MAMIRHSTGILLAAGVLLAAGCAHAPRSVADPDPAAKIPAIETAVRRDDQTVVPQMVKDLDSDDPAVRLYTVEGLRKLTGRDFGYRYFDDADHRKPAVERWKRWLASRT
ncbi:MAG TPA: hypothetical protein VG326_14765 [Tepidisphaeraceae bacterium]|nr:hypothetical protein [Tepidisphaeraceae bacterium]